MRPDRASRQPSRAGNEPGVFGQVRRVALFVVGAIGLWFAGLGIAVTYADGSPSTRRWIKLGFSVLGLAFATYCVADGHPELAPFVIAFLLAQLTGFHLLDRRRARMLAREQARRRQRAREGWA